ncbi:hypothetical protein [Flaviaesturariibacter terrae]
MKKISLFLLLALPAACFAQSAQSKQAASQPQPVRKIINGDTIYVQPAPAAAPQREMKIINGDTIYVQPAPAAGAAKSSGRRKRG